MALAAPTLVVRGAGGGGGAHCGLVRSADVPVRHLALVQATGACVARRRRVAAGAAEDVVAVNVPAQLHRLDDVSAAVVVIELATHRYFFGCFSWCLLMSVASV